MSNTQTIRGLAATWREEAEFVLNSPNSRTAAHMLREKADELEALAYVLEAKFFHRRGPLPRSFGRELIGERKP